MKKRKITNMKALWMAGFLIAAISTMFTMAGCSDDKSTSSTNPTSATFKPVGTVQGLVQDAVTLQPIVGAKVGIGGQEGTTDAKGQFVIKDVPATTDALNGTVAAVYQVVTDMRKVTSPVNMAATPAPSVKYPEFTYHTVSVSFTSLNDSSPCPDPLGPAGSVNEPDVTTCGTNSTNHDTPVDGLVAGIIGGPITVGKLDANIKGLVAGCGSDIVGTTSDFFTPVGDGYTVKLFSALSNDTGSGAAGHLLTQTLTDANGEFTFTNVEAGLPVVISVFPNADQSNNPLVSVVNVTPGDGQTLDLTDAQASVALHACSSDIHGPRIVEVIPEPGSDQTVPTSGNLDVTLKFSEPVAQNSFTDTNPSGVLNLFDFIEVNFDGPKAGNLSYSLAWNTAFDELTVTIPNTGVSSLYHVRVLNTGSVLTDAAGNGAEMGVCPDDGLAPPPYGIAANTNVDGEDCTVWFSTKGTSVPAAADVTLVNEAGIDEGTAQVGSFDWGMTPGAKTYNVYCRTVQVWGGTEQPHTYSLIGAPAGVVLGSSATINFDALAADSGADADAFVENDEIQLKYDCYVAGVSADQVEGDESNIVRVEDNVGPLLVEDAPPAAGSLFCGTGAVAGGLPSGIGALCTDGTNIDQIVLGYNEEMEEISTETTGNYTFGTTLASGTAVISTTTSPVYNTSNHMVLLTLSDTLAPEEITRPVVRTGANGLVNTTVAGGDTIAPYIGAGGGVFAAAGFSGPCVEAGSDAVFATTVTGDDAIAGTVIFSGADGVCNSTANDTPAGLGDDIQVVAVSARSGVCGTEAAGAGNDVPEAASDVDTTAGAGGGLILTGADGTCETTAANYVLVAPAVSGTLVVPPGSSTPNTAGILPGADLDRDTTTLNNAAGCPTGCDDAFDGTKITVSGVTDVAGKTIRTTGDEFNADGNVE